jgi:hypothetical protein
VTHVDGCAMQREGALDYFDGAVDAGTETTRLGKQ